MNKSEAENSGGESAAQATGRRVLLKISGEALMGTRAYGLDPIYVARVAREIKQVVESGTQVCMVVGGGNIFRGVSGAAEGMDRVTGDHMGMLATVINALAMRGALEDIGVDTRVQSAIPMDNVCEPFIRNRAVRHLAKGRVVIFAAGIGSPFFTTDTAAALRASEMNCSMLMKGTKVDGVYDSDPNKNPNARRYNKLGYDQVIQEDLGVMDMTAVTLAKENHIPIAVFSLHEEGSMSKVVKMQGTFTLVS